MGRRDAGADPLGPSPGESGPGSSAPDPGRASRPYSIAVGVVLLAVAGFAGVKFLLSDRPLAAGLAPGSSLPQFAAPSATGRLEGDANVTRKGGEGTGGSRVAACNVRGRDVIRVCDFFDRPLVLVAWFPRCGVCESQLDTVERVRGRFPGVAFVGLDIRDSHADARSLVMKRGWRFPIALDRDGAVGALYGVAVGPSTFFAYPGGTAMSTAIGELDERSLVARLRRLLRASRRRGLLG